MSSPNRGEVLATLVPHTTSPRGSRFEVSVETRLLRHGVFDAQNLVTIPHAKLVRQLGILSATQLCAVEADLTTFTFGDSGQASFIGCHLITRRFRRRHGRDALGKGVLRAGVRPRRTRADPRAGGVGLPRPEAPRADRRGARRAGAPQSRGAHPEPRGLARAGARPALGRRPLAEHGEGRVARNQVDEAEDEERDSEEDGDDGDAAPDRVPRHERDYSPGEDGRRRSGRPLHAGAVDG